MKKATNVKGKPGQVYKSNKALQGAGLNVLMKEDSETLWSIPFYIEVV